MSHGVKEVLAAIVVLLILEFLPELAAALGLAAIAL